MSVEKNRRYDLHGSGQINYNNNTACYVSYRPVDEVNNTNELERLDTYFMLDDK